MALPQGIPFRQTLAYVTDNSYDDPELTNGGNPSYPRTTAQGISVGWETSSTQYQQRNQNSANDSRIAGVCNIEQTGAHDYRVDLPSAGTYEIRLAAGDNAYARPVAWEVFDTSSSLGALATGSTSASQRYKDATDTEYTRLTWAGSNAAASKTFATTIFRLRGGTSLDQSINYLHVAAVGGTDGAAASAGAATVLGVGAARVDVAASSAGTSPTTVMVGTSSAAAVMNAAGTSTAQAVGVATSGIVEGDAFAAGTSTAIAVAAAGISADGLARGTSTAIAVGEGGIDIDTDTIITLGARYRGAKRRREEIEQANADLMALVAAVHPNTQPTYH